MHLWARAEREAGSLSTWPIAPAAEGVAPALEPLLFEKPATTPEEPLRDAAEGGGGSREVVSSAVPQAAEEVAEALARREGSGRCEPEERRANGEAEGAAGNYPQEGATGEVGDS